MVEGHTHPEPPLPSIYLEEAKTDCTGPSAAMCPYVEAGVDRQGHLSHAGYLSPRDGCSGRPNEETAGTLLHTEQGRVSALVSCFLQRYREDLISHKWDCIDLNSCVSMTVIPVDNFIKMFLT